MSLYFWEWIFVFLKYLLNQVPVVSWFDDANDRELLDLIPFFKRLAEAEDIFAFLSNERLPLGHPDNIAAAQVNEGPALTS